MQIAKDIVISASNDSECVRVAITARVKSVRAEPLAISPRQKHKLPPRQITQYGRDFRKNQESNDTTDSTPGFVITWRRCAPTGSLKIRLSIRRRMPSAVGPGRLREGTTVRRQEVRNRRVRNRSRSGHSRLRRSRKGSRSRMWNRAFICCRRSWNRTL